MDADGKCSGFWVRMNVIQYDGEAREFIPINYGIPFPFDTIRLGEQIYIVDYSITPDEMRRLFTITENITWIDHHKTAIEKYEGFEREIKGLRYDGIAGCMLTYCFTSYMVNLFGDQIKPFDISMTHDAPLFTKLIADWDVWKFDYGQNTRDFITAFNAYGFEPEGMDWIMFTKLKNWKLEEAGLIEQGQIMNIFRDGWAKSYMDLGFETAFEGAKCYAVNLGRCNSEYFKSLPEGKYDVLMPFAFNGDIFTVSLYSTTIDVSEIAKKYGGGGHKGASGFQCTELPFKKIGSKTNASPLQPFVDLIGTLSTCNECHQKTCEYRPSLGKTVRYNCPLFLGGVK